MLEIQTPIIDPKLRLVSSRLNQMSRFNPLNSETSIELARLQTEFDEIRQDLTTDNLLYLRHLVQHVPLEELEQEYQTTITTRSLDTPTLKKAFCILSEMQAMKQGATPANCSDLLWRVAIRNETKRPEIAIQAINALHKIKSATNPSNPSNNPQLPPSITVVVQNNALTNAPLDQV